MIAKGGLFVMVSFSQPHSQCVLSLRRGLKGRHGLLGGTSTSTHPQKCMDDTYIYIYIFQLQP